MSRKSVATGFIVALFIAPAFADVPDGRGGRTSPHGLNQPRPAVEAAHACCSSIVPAPSGEVVRNPAELKATGHLARVIRHERVVSAVACYKRVAYRPTAFASPVEAKTVSHVAARTVPNDARLGRNCCETGRCPMRSDTTASR